MSRLLRDELAADQVGERFGHVPRPWLHTRADVRPRYDGPDLGPGRPLWPRERAALGSALGVDLTAVRVHDDDRAATVARSYEAEALATGQHVVLGRDRYPNPPEPTPVRGRDLGLLAHEVAHTVQQRGAGAPTVQRQAAQRRDGVGRTPPPEPFERGKGSAAEDAHVLFEQDGVRLDRAAQQAILAPLRDRQTPVQVDIDGYASTEGDDEYNVNLSAHRAAAVGRLLTLPAGSRVRLIAHGETAAFGSREQSRRVGIRVTALGAEPPGRPLLLDAPRAGVGFGLPRLQLDPHLLTPPTGPGTLPAVPVPTLQPPTLFGPPATTRPLPAGTLLDPHPPLVIPPLPGPPLTPRPVLVPDPYRLREPLASSAFAPQPAGQGVDWGTISGSYSARGLRLGDRDQQVIRSHFQTYYGLLVRSGVPPDRAARLMNAAIASAVDRELARENPNVADRLNSDLRLAYPNATQVPLGSVDLLDLIRRLGR